jgi:hypothetical protein|tara:strand:- start:868 stop:1896 length:1029 start_codon:yes stop_codon:yes gene_type:complete
MEIKEGAPRANTEIRAGSISGTIPKESLRDFFRIITAKQNSLTEVYPKAILIGLQDVEELGSLLQQKFSCYSSAGIAFSAIVSYANYRTREYPTWADFKGGEWSSPDVIDSLTLRWEFLVQFEEGEKPFLFNVTLRCGNGLKPHVYFQYMMSKDDHDGDKLELLSSPMSCRVDFSDPIISQELLDLVARWHKGRRSLESFIPGLTFIRAHHSKFSGFIKFFTPMLMATLALVALYQAAVTAGLDSAVTNEFLIKSLGLFGISIATVLLSVHVSKLVGKYIERAVTNIGRTHALEFTNGDRNHQTKLLARSKRSLANFLIAGGMSILWNVLAAALIYFWFPFY